MTFVIHYIDSFGTQNDIIQNMVKVDFIIKKPQRSKYAAQEMVTINLKMEITPAIQEHRVQGAKNL